MLEFNTDELVTPPHHDLLAALQSARMAAKENANIHGFDASVDAYRLARQPSTRSNGWFGYAAIVTAKRCTCGDDGCTHPSEPLATALENHGFTVTGIAFEADHVTLYAPAWGAEYTPTAPDAPSELEQESPARPDETGGVPANGF